jgi:nitrate reductase NapAB chaperone NapD
MLFLVVGFLKIKKMEDILEYLLYNSELTVRNENNSREVSVSLNLEDGWCVYASEFDGGKMNVILESSNKDAILDCINFEC